MKFLRIIFITNLIFVISVKTEKVQEVTLSDETIEKILNIQKAITKSKFENRIKIEEILKKMEHERQEKLIQYQENLRLENEKKLEQERIKQREKEIKIEEQTYKERRKNELEDSKKLADYHEKMRFENDKKVEELRAKNEEEQEEKKHKKQKELIDYQAISDINIKEKIHNKKHQYAIEKNNWEIELERKKLKDSLNNQENYEIEKLQRTAEFHTKHEELIIHERNARLDTEDKEHAEQLKRKKEREEKSIIQDNELRLKKADSRAETEKKAYGAGSKSANIAKELRNRWIQLVGVGALQGAGFMTVALIPIFTVRYGYHYFIKKLNDPRIIIETSIGSWPYEWAKYIFRFRPSKAKEKLQDMILAQAVKNQIEEMVKFQQAHLKNKEGLDNILFTGPAGTGKTMAAKALAGELGMDYIILTGSSFFQENAGVKAIDQIFGKMTRGRKVVIFIDEIESLIGTRSGKNPDGDGYRLVNQLLNYTSTPNKNFILIGATNHSHLIDGAFHRRFQHVVEMPLPGQEERIQSLIFFRNKQLLTKKNKDHILSVFSDHIIKQMAIKTEGLSYAELQTIIDHIKSAARISPQGITYEIIAHAVDRVMNKEKTFNKVFLKK